MLIFSNVIILYMRLALKVHEVSHTRGVIMDERKQRILRAIIEDTLKSAEPV